MGGDELLTRAVFVTAEGFIALSYSVLRHLPPRFCDQSMEVMLRHLMAAGHSHGGFEVDAHEHEHEHGAEEHMEAAEYTLDLR
jgi:hypothetical protein